LTFKLAEHIRQVVYRPVSVINTSVETRVA
jgi:hypothetical protein